MSQTVENAIKSRIYGHGRGWIFTPKHFVDLGSPSAIRFVLFSLRKKNFIRRLSQGVYDYPAQHEVLGTLSPGVDAIAKALAEKYGFRIQPAGAYAANLIGISEQVPGRVIFMTDGPSKKVKVGKIEISFKHTSLNNMFAAGTPEGLVIQAFKFMGQSHIDPKVLAATKRLLKKSNRRDFEKNLKFAPAWIRKILFVLVEGEI
jgi:hypothetical protein